MQACSLSIRLIHFSIMSFCMFSLMLRLCLCESFVGNLTHIEPLMNLLNDTTKVIWMLQGSIILSISCLLQLSSCMIWSSIAQVNILDFPNRLLCIMNLLEGRCHEFAFDGV